jgi:hypothetical protein
VPEGRSLLHDLGAFARYVVAAPLLIAAESVSAHLLGRGIVLFVDQGIVRDADRGRLLDIIDTLRRWRDDARAELAVVVIAFCLSAAAVHAYPLAELPMWHRSAADASALSPAGWWHSLVSLPLLLMLVLGWLWRLLLWTCFLYLVSRLQLHLLPVHPDKAAGIGFLGYSVRAFGLVGAAFGAMVAGTVANRVLHEGATLADARYQIAGVVVIVTVLFTAPLLIFSRRLLKEWRRGVKDYGRLASAFGRQFEHECLGDPPRPHDDMLERPDFSAATDLYQVADRVHDMRMVPVDLASVAALAGATLLPFVPVVLIALPFDVILKELVGLLR